MRRNSATGWLLGGAAVLAWLWASRRVDREIFRDVEGVDDPAPRRWRRY